MRHRQRIFDQTICFTCFEQWVDSIREIAEQNPVEAINAFLTLADFCLYDIEPEHGQNPWGMAWPVVRGEARRSINNRRRAFGCDNTDLTMAIIEYHESHKQDSQRAIAKAVGCSLGKVNKVMKALKAEQQST